ncbi:MAG TPA: hypothetical protein PLU43_02270 [Lachnospiraceae bacterium]|nr:hypothetical protein [Lachnospiraceae bacterium]
MYGQEQTTREMIIREYREDVEKLLKYLPWLLEKEAKDVAGYYEGDGTQKLIKIPVYDSTLLAFVKEAEKTKFMDKNYPYVYTRHRIKSCGDERRLLQQAKIQDIDIFKGILSKYVLEGKRKSSCWRDAVGEKIFTTALSCLKELFFSHAA